MSLHDNLSVWSETNNKRQYGTAMTSHCRRRRLLQIDVQSDDLAICRSARARVSKGRRGAKVSGGQASKGIRWMPWHQEAMKDVVKLR